MEDATTLLLDRLGRPGSEPVFGRASGTIRLDLVEDGRDDDSWLLSVQKGAVTVTREHADADCTLRCERALFERIAAGEVNLMAAVLRQAVVLEGRPDLFVLFQSALPGPPR